MKPHSSHLHSDWQRNLVLCAKNTYVWLDQLSRKYNRKFTYLHEIPEEELDVFRTYGINGLWLIGIWKRSPASRKIKELYGKTNLIASAYSIFDYVVSEDLGGHESLELLKEKMARKGLYLACDMVPNHTGIDSPWVLTHPEWFIFTKQKPVESWQFTSVNLSPCPDIELQLENGYFDQTSAAEVFRYKSRSNGKEIYIYHGNDGTSMPWNDTAQLNYLVKEVRENIKKKIFEVAKQFNIIRLDAAMTLVKQHYKRLWFPDEGEEKFIPTRDSAAMTQQEFDRMMPSEFWKEVIEELPNHNSDTLLLAEAFWLMERFFIEELGMHRVYNSAFMNLLRDEENEKFHTYLRDILVDDPLILERFVNYITTPDEKTAIEQFGKGKKYFGVCGLMASLPGLPLFGHGQIEGLTERYRMDFRKAHLDEYPDEEFINEHKRLIAPLFHHRARFSNAKNLELFNFYSNGTINKDVFAFANFVNELRTCMIYYNRNQPIQGFIMDSVSGNSNSMKNLPPPISLLTALNIPATADNIVFKELRHQFTRVCSRDELMKGFFFELNPYEFLVFDVCLG